MPYADKACSLKTFNYITVQASNTKISVREKLQSERTEQSEITFLNVSAMCVIRVMSGVYKRTMCELHILLGPRLRRAAINHCPGHWLSSVIWGMQGLNAQRIANGAGNRIERISAM